MRICHSLDFIPPFTMNSSCLIFQSYSYMIFTASLHRAMEHQHIFAASFEIVNWFHTNKEVYWFIIKPLCNDNIGITHHLKIIYPLLSFSQFFSTLELTLFSLVLTYCANIQKAIFQPSLELL